MREYIFHTPSFIWFFFVLVRNVFLVRICDLWQDYANLVWFCQEQMLQQPCKLSLSLKINQLFSCGSLKVTFCTFQKEEAKDTNLGHREMLLLLLRQTEYANVWKTSRERKDHFFLHHPEKEPFVAFYFCREIIFTRHFPGMRLSFSFFLSLDDISFPISPFSCWK